MPESLKSAKLWAAIISQAVAIVTAIVAFVSPSQSVQQLIGAILLGVSQIAVLVLTALWGADVGEKRAERRADEFLRAVE